MPTNVPVSGLIVPYGGGTFYVGVAGYTQYDNTTSGLAATDVQDAIDELATGSGGNLVIVATKAARNAIPNGARREGMIAYILDSASVDPATYWQLLPAPWAGTDGDWAPAGPLQVQLAGVLVASRGTLNFIQGSGISLTVVDDPTNDSADVTIAGVPINPSLSGVVLASGGTLSALDPLTVAHGGTGAVTLTAHGVLLGEGTSAVGFATIGTAGRVLTDQGAGADPIFAALATSAIPATQRTFTAVLGQGVAVAVAVNAAGNYLVCSKAGSFVRWDVACVTAPTGANLVLDVYKSSNQGSTWTSLWASNPGNRPTVVAAANNGGGTSFDTTTFAAGDWLRFDVVQVGSTIAGQNVTLEIFAYMSQ